MNFSLLTAKIISTVINPLFLISLVPFVLVYKITQNTDIAIYWSVISFVFIAIFSLFVLGGVKLGYFSNLDISNRKQRPLLYSFAIALSLVYLLFLYILKAPFVLFLGVIALALGLAVGDFINTKIKASLHVGTLVAFITTLVEVYGFYLVFLYLLVPVVAWARIKTHNHTIREIVAGGIVGFILTLAVYSAFEVIIK
jgi:hypothetical protein